MLINIKDWWRRKTKSISSSINRTPSVGSNVEHDHNQVHHDVVIIGGGLCGLHCAYKLIEHHDDLSIGLYEKKPYLGGRISTKRHDNYVIEYVTPNYEPGKRNRFMTLLSELDIHSENLTPSPFAPSAPEFASLLPDEVKVFEKEMCVNGRLPDVLMLCMYCIRKVLAQNKIHHPWEVHAEELQQIVKKTCKYKNRFLHEVGILEIFHDFFSVECLQYMRRCEGQFGMISNNPQASEFFCRMFSMFAIFRWNVCTVGEGLNAIIERLSDKLIGKVDVQCSSKLLGVRCAFPHVRDRPTYKLSFESGSTVTCDHLVLTVPPENLCSIAGVPNTIKMLIRSSLKRVKLFKIFVIVENPPWGNGKAELMTDIELIHNMSDPQHTEGMMVFYTDTPYSTDENDESAILLRNKVSEILRVTYPQEKPSWKIKVVEMRDWYAKPALHSYVWHAGVDVKRVLGELGSFSLGFSPKENVHICGETFSDHQCFMEGAISSAEKVADKIAADIEQDHTKHERQLAYHRSLSSPQ